MQKSRFSKARLSWLFAINSWLFEIPWTKSLAGKRILVVHPFKDSIETQYHERRTLLFANQDVLPEFSKLTVVQAVQSIAGNKPDGIETWFEALDKMKREIAASEFDVALIGAGAHGLPLAAYVKQIGKQSIHMGGELQFLFGIIGRRWIDEQGHMRRRFVNEHWIEPAESERPQNWQTIEGGCYW